MRSYKRAYALVSGAQSHARMTHGNLRSVRRSGRGKLHGKDGAADCKIVRISAHSYVTRGAPGAKAVH